MPSLIGSILRQATRQENEPIHVLSASTHEPYQTELAKANTVFYLARGFPGFREWSQECRKIPSNTILLNSQRGTSQLGLYHDYDVVLSQHKSGQFQVFSEIARQFNLPLIQLEHTLPMNDRMAHHAKQMRGNFNVFISDYNRDAWRFAENEAEVIYHGIDTKLFSPNPSVQKQKWILSICNDWKNRDWCCGFNLWQNITNKLPVRVRGNTPGLSTGTQSVEELLMEYRSASVFLNTSTVSPIPTVVLEAMACGVPVISTATCCLPEIIENGVNGFISNKESTLRDYCNLLLNDNQLCQQMGAAARQTIINQFPLDKFVEKWNNLLERAADKVYGT